jgi:tetraacyldisaccharide 4'-kinase
VADPRRVERLWGSDAPLAAALRVALLPAAGMFRAGVAVRNMLYDRGALRIQRPPLPVVSIGNISVGGAGKTPVSAWLARTLADRGAQPAVVMRGYGGDEPLVHRELNRDVPVFTGADRVSGIRAAARAGCDVAVLDDAFQHRRVARDEDVVLVSADTWAGSMAVLPAGPWREPLRALRRATLGIITVKAQSEDVIDDLVEGISGIAPALPVAVMRLELTGLRALAGTGAEMLSSVRGRRVLAVAAIADPQPFFRQLRAAGAEVTERPYPDHYAFREHDAVALHATAARHDMLVCTLKDAVKLRNLWPPDAVPAWYVSQAVRVEHGAQHVAALVRRLLAARADRASRNRDSTTSP